MRKIYNKIKPLFIPILIALIIIVFFHTVFMIGYIPTSSMEPTLKTGSLILGLRLYNELHKGDIIVFHYEDSYLVKRIAAVDGDLIEHNDQTKSVPGNHFYVLGDNSKHSYDSRYWKDPFVSIDNVIAKVILPI